MWAHPSHEPEAFSSHLGLARSQIQLFSTSLGPSLTTPPTETLITLLFPFPYAPFWGRRGKHYCYINYFIYIKSGMTLPPTLAHGHTYTAMTTSNPEVLIMTILPDPRTRRQRPCAGQLLC